MVAYVGHRVLSEVIDKTENTDAMHQLVNGILEARVYEKNFILTGEVSSAQQVNAHI